MAREFTLPGLLKHLEEVQLKATMLPINLAMDAAPILERNVKDVMGTTLLRDLAPSTQEDRVRMQFTPNDPLVRSGELRDTIEHTAHGPVAATGTSDMRAKWLNDGVVGHIPPRPHFLIGLGFAVTELKPWVDKLVQRVIE
jgi:hypothetical protein